MACVCRLDHLWGDSMLILCLMESPSLFFLIQELLKKHSPPGFWCGSKYLSLYIPLAPNKSQLLLATDLLPKQWVYFCTQKGGFLWGMTNNNCKQMRNVIDWFIPKSCDWSFGFFYIVVVKLVISTHPLPVFCSSKVQNSPTCMCLSAYESAELNNIYTCVKSSALSYCWIKNL